MTKLGDLKRGGGIPAKAFGEPPATNPPSKLSQITLARGEEITLPVLGRVWMQVLGHNQCNLVEGGVIKAMKNHDIPLSSDMWVFTVALERNARMLAYAVRDPDDTSKLFGTVEEWLEMDDQLINACGIRYGEVRDRLDPLAPNFEVNPERAKEITELFKKKEKMSLLSFGIDELVSWLLSGVVQLSSSPTPSSTNTESSSET